MEIFCIILFFFVECFAFFRSSLVFQLFGLYVDVWLSSLMDSLLLFLDGNNMYARMCWLLFVVVAVFDIFISLLLSIFGFLTFRTFLMVVFVAIFHGWLVSGWCMCFGTHWYISKFTAAGITFDIVRLVEDERC